MFKPSAASTTNQVIITGPKARPTRSVPKRWMPKRPSRITRPTGITQCANAGEITLRPSSAPSTVTGGVIMPSPKNSEAPKMPRMPTV